MCLTALALDANRRFPLVVAANRDEFFDRPAARLAWWTPTDGGPPILSGVDQQAGGTWMGLTAQGRFALVTNVRRPFTAEPQAPSRGLIVPRWLRGDQRADRFWPHVALAGHAPFNLIAADFRAGDCFWASSEKACPRRMERGVFGLSNGMLDEPWPKVQALKAQLSQSLDVASGVDDLATRLFAALADRSVAPDSTLPSTGLDKERERFLSAAFIRSPDGRYGTRCSTLVIAEKVGKHLVTHVLERSFTAGPGMALLRRATLKDWPPKYQLAPFDAAQDAHGAELSPVSESELAETPLEMAPKRRVRSLLRPSGKR